MLLEICIGSVDDARAAAAHGADRLELCGALELGGLTPSLGLIEQVIGAVEAPVIVMIRPRAGGFCLSDHDFRVMQRDAELALAAGAAGIVFGALNADASIDRPRVEQFTRLAGDRDAVFHRAFDFVPDKLVALEILADLRVTRLLTTGGGRAATDGLDTLRQLRRQAAGRIEIMAGGGVNATNVAQVVAATDCTQIHGGCSKSVVDPSLSPSDAASLCDVERLAAGALRAVDGEKVAALKRALAR